MNEITLEAVLAARDQRKQTQEALLQRFQRPLVCFTMNIAGPQKRSALIDLVFRAGTEQLRAQLGPFLHEQTAHCAAGSTFYGVLPLEAAQAKRLAERLEARAPAGRLLDLDVIQTDGSKLSRAVPRACLVCGGPVAVCARSRAHGLDAVLAETDRLLREAAAEYLARLAVASLIEEVHVTPKPGLVDENNSGAHSDMDLLLFETSARALFPYFRTSVLLGMRAPDCMPRLQAEGLQAEQRMLAVTQGVNTHKGAIYAFGLLLAGLGRFFAAGAPPLQTAAALAAVGRAPEGETHGSRVRRLYGISGAREEALAGFPHVQSAVRLLQGGLPPSVVLMHLVSDCPDTNLYYRGGAGGRAFAVSAANAVLAAAPAERSALLLQTDAEFIARNLSPGGCADLLAAALFLAKLNIAT